MKEFNLNFRCCFNRQRKLHEEIPDHPVLVGCGTTAIIENRKEIATSVRSDGLPGNWSKRNDDNGKNEATILYKSQQSQKLSFAASRANFNGQLKLMRSLRMAGQVRK